MGERALLSMANKLPDPPAVRRRAHQLSRRAEGHNRTADRIETDDSTNELAGA
jgi:hypothetical protein